MSYKTFYLWKFITNYPELRKLWNHLRWFHNFETLAAILSLPSLTLEPNPFAPHSWCRIRSRCPPLCQCGLGRRSPATNHWRATDRNPTPISHCRHTLHLCLPSLLLRAYPLSLHLASTVKRAPCHVLETRKPHVMDGRVVSRGLWFTLGNPEPQPSCLAMVVATSLVHPS
jgi:hypothetical protein